MSSVSLLEGSVSGLAAQAEAVGMLAQDSGAFAAVMAAFESRDPEAFRWILGRLEMLPRCELICEWIRVKLCGLRCIEVCGPPNPTLPVPELSQFARALIQLAANETLLRRVVDAVSCGDAESYRAAIAEAKLQEYCHLLCRYVCSTIYRRICEIFCTPLPVLVGVADAALDIRVDAEALARALANENLAGVIGKAAVALDCVPLRAAIEQAGFTRDCEIICRLICVWRCVWECRTLCVEPPVIFAGTQAIEEARRFALAARHLAEQPRALVDLVAAVMGRNADAYSAIVNRFGLGSYCWQVCGWVCSEVCHEFCICVCPPQLFPEFTAIGGYNYQTQIDSVLPATGLTDGDTRAFFETLRLNGVLTQTLGGKPLEYRFEYQPITVVTTNLAAAITAVQTTISVTSSVGFPATPFNAVIGGASGGYEIVTVTMVVATTWTVSRAQQGTAAGAATASATITTGAAASGGWTPIPQGWIDTTVIGIAEVFHPLPTPHFEFPNVTIKPVNPADIPVSFAPGDWVQVPQGSNIFLNGNMINLISTMLPSFTAVDETGVTASNPANHPLPTDHCYGLRMRVRQQGSAVESDGGTCAVVAIDNTLYNNVNHHPEWDGGIVNPQYAVVMVDIKELQGAGCAGITSSLTVLFTASHPNLGAVGIQMIGPGGPYPFTLPMPVPETGDWYGVATPNGWKLADLTPCAYIVQLSVDLLLTTGDQNFGPPIIDQIAFCLTKGKGK